jgi:hypothetical protein
MPSCYVAPISWSGSERPSPQPPVNGRTSSDGLGQTLTYGRRGATPHRPSADGYGRFQSLHRFCLQPCHPWHFPTGSRHDGDTSWRISAPGGDSTVVIVTVKRRMLHLIQDHRSVDPGRTTYCATWPPESGAFYVFAICDKGEPPQPDLRRHRTHTAALCRTCSPLRRRLTSVRRSARSDGFANRLAVQCSVTIAPPCPPARSDVPPCGTFPCGYPDRYPGADCSSPTPPQSPARQCCGGPEPAAAVASCRAAVPSAGPHGRRSRLTELCDFKSSSRLATRCT